MSRRTKDSRFFVYDIAGNLTQKTDRNERVTQYTYDKLNRRTAEKWMSGASPVRTISYAYDSAGQLTSAADSDSAYAYGCKYRCRGQLRVGTLKWE